MYNKYYSQNFLSMTVDNFIFLGLKDIVILKKIQSLVYCTYKTFSTQYLKYEPEKTCIQFQTHARN